MLSDLNFSSVSETNLNWSSLIPSKRPQNASDENGALLSASSQDDGYHHNVNRAVSLQDAFRDSKKKFIARSKQRQREAAAAFDKQPEMAVGQRHINQLNNAPKHDRSKSSLKSKTTSGTKDSSKIKHASSGKTSSTNNNSSNSSESNVEKLDKGWLRISINS